MGLFGAIKSIGKGIAKGIGKVAGIAAPVAGLIPGIGSLASPILSKISKVGGALGGFARDNPELIAGGIAAIQNARTQGERDKIRDEILGNARADRTRREGFLNQIDVKGVRGIKAPDLSTIFNDPNNPFARSGRTPDPAATGVTNPAVVPVTGGAKEDIRRTRGSRGLGKKIRGVRG